MTLKQAIASHWSRQPRQSLTRSTSRVRWFLLALLLLITNAATSIAQTVPLGPRLVLPYQTVIDSTGVPLPGAQLFFYASGTNTPLTTYSDPLLSTPNANPVTASAAGVFPNIFLSGNYKVVLTDSLGNQIWTADPVYGAKITAQCNDVNAQTGTSYTLAASDNCQLVTFNNSSSNIAVTLPSPTANASFGQWSATLSSIGTGTIIVTPQGGATIGGQSSLTIKSGNSAWILSDGTNYQVVMFGIGSVTSVTCGTGLSGGVITSAGTCALIYGTTANTAAQGNDSRITGAAQLAAVQTFTGANTFSGTTTFSGHVIATGLLGSGTVSSSICLDGSGNLYKSSGSNCYSSGSAGAGGANTQLQYNNSSVLAGINLLTWNAGSQTLTLIDGATWTTSGLSGSLGIGLAAGHEITWGTSPLYISGSGSAGSDCIGIKESTTFYFAFCDDVGADFSIGAVGKIGNIEFNNGSNAITTLWTDSNGYLNIQGSAGTTLSNGVIKLGTLTAATRINFPNGGNDTSSGLQVGSVTSATSDILFQAGSSVSLPTPGSTANGAGIIGLQTAGINIGGTNYYYPGLIVQGFHTPSSSGCSPFCQVNDITLMDSAGNAIVGLQTPVNATPGHPFPFMIGTAKSVTATNIDEGMYVGQLFLADVIPSGTVEGPRIVWQPGPSQTSPQTGPSFLGIGNESPSNYNVFIGQTQNEVTPWDTSDVYQVDVDVQGCFGVAGAGGTSFGGDPVSYMVGKMCPIASGGIAIQNPAKSAAAPISASYLVAGTLYSAAGTALPSCVSGLKGSKATVSDATSPTYHGTYTSGGAVTSGVICNGSAWVTD